MTVPFPLVDGELCAR